MPGPCWPLPPVRLYMLAPSGRFSYSTCRAPKPAPVGSNHCLLLKQHPRGLAAPQLDWTRTPYGLWAETSMPRLVADTADRLLTTTSVFCYDSSTPPGLPLFQTAGADTGRLNSQAALALPVWQHNAAAFPLCSTVPHSHHLLLAPTSPAASNYTCGGVSRVLHGCSL